jgi:hypothetical protein
VNCTLVGDDKRKEMVMKKYKVLVTRQLIEVLELEVEAENQDEAEKKGNEKALDTDCSKWCSETIDYQVEAEEEV